MASSTTNKPSTFATDPQDGSDPGAVRSREERVEVRSLALENDLQSEPHLPTVEAPPSAAEASSPNGDTPPCQPGSAEGEEGPPAEPASLALIADPAAPQVEPGSPAADYKVGYGKPPLETRFKKGQSGNPSGRPAGRTSIMQLILQESRRMVEEGPSDGEKMQAIRAVLRAQCELALSGNGTAQRHFIKLAMEAGRKAIEAEKKATDLEKEETGGMQERNDRPVDPLGNPEELLSPSEPLVGGAEQTPSEPQPQSGAVSLGNPKEGPTGEPTVMDFVEEEGARMVFQQGPAGTEEMPVIQAIVRAECQTALNGHGRAQRHFISLVLEAEKHEREAEKQAAEADKQANEAEKRRIDAERRGRDVSIYDNWLRENDPYYVPDTRSIEELRRDFFEKSMWDVSAT
jgi:hypothetical protein